MKINVLFLLSFVFILVLLIVVYISTERTLTIEGCVLSIKYMDNGAMIYLKTEKGVEKIIIKQNTIEDISIGDILIVKGDIVNFKGNKEIRGEEILQTKDL